MAATSLAGLSRPGLPLSCSVPTGKKSAAARVKSEAPTRGRESLDVQHSLLHTTRPPLRHGWGHQKKKKKSNSPAAMRQRTQPTPRHAISIRPSTYRACAAGVYTRSRRCVAERGALPPDPRPAGGPGRGLASKRAEPPAPLPRILAKFNSGRTRADTNAREGLLAGRRRTSLAAPRAARSSRVRQRTREQQPEISLAEFGPSQALRY